MMNQTIRYRRPSPTKATHFWWIRHARVPEVTHKMYGNLDVDCDTSDEKLFTGVARKLPDQAVWITSPLKRTHQTAKALTDKGVVTSSQLIDHRITEQDFGDFNGLTHDELFEKRTDNYMGFWPISPEQQAPNGESFAMLRQRVEDFVAAMTQQYQGQDLVCVAHRGTILAALQIALNQPMLTSVSFDIANVSLTRLTFHADVPAGGPKWRVVEVSWLP